MLVSYAFIEWALGPVWKSIFFPLKWSNQNYEMKIWAAEGVLRIVEIFRRRFSSFRRLVSAYTVQRTFTSGPVSDEIIIVILEYFSRLFLWVVKHSEESYDEVADEVRRRRKSQGNEDLNISCLWRRVLTMLIVTGELQPRARSPHTEWRDEKEEDENWVGKFEKLNTFSCSSEKKRKVMEEFFFYSKNSNWFLILSRLFSILSDGTVGAKHWEHLNIDKRRKILLKEIFFTVHGNFLMKFSIENQKIFKRIFKLHFSFSFYFSSANFFFGTWSH